MKIAAFVDIDGNTLALDSSGMIHIYEERNSEWYCINKIPFYIDKSMNIADIRKSIYALAPNLEGCRALIVKRSVGIFNAIFEDELHIRVFAVQGDLYQELLNQIKKTLGLEFLEAIKKAETCKDKQETTVPIPVGEISKGCYQIDLIKVQENHDSLSSKEILLPFLQNNTFTELEIICLHTPKWLEKELTNFNFKVTTEFRKDGSCRAFVQPINKK